MTRERALQGLLVVVGSLFVAAIYPVTMILWQRDQTGYTDAMMLSLYVTLGIHAEPIGASQPDCFHGMVELRPRSSYGGASFR